MTIDEVKKGKVIYPVPPSEKQNKIIYQCMHTSTGKMLISKFYKVGHEILVHRVVQSSPVQHRAKKNDRDHPKHGVGFEQSGPQKSDQILHLLPEHVQQK